MNLFGPLELERLVAPSDTKNSHSLGRLHVPSQLFCLYIVNRLPQVATPEIAQDVHAVIREILTKMYGEKVAADTRILYGGSVSPESVDGLMAKPDIDGTLVGGASLDATKFGRIINFEEVVVAA